MIQENEVAMMLIGIWLFFYSRKIKFTEFPEYKYFFAGFYCLLLGWVFTVLETFVLTDYFNALEHLSYALSSAFLLIWCFRTFFIKRSGGRHRQ